MVLNEIMLAALHRSKRNGVDRQPRFEARVDSEQPADFAQFDHSLTPERRSGGFEPLKS
jgi:hypothetical protein